MSTARDDVIAEIRDNLMSIRKGPTCSWSSAGGGSPIILATISTITDPPKEFTLTVHVDESTIRAEYLNLDLNAR